MEFNLFLEILSETCQNLPVESHNAQILHLHRDLLPVLHYEEVVVGQAVPVLAPALDVPVPVLEVVGSNEHH